MPNYTYYNWCCQVQYHNGSKNLVIPPIPGIWCRHSNVSRNKQNLSYDIFSAYIFAHVFCKIWHFTILEKQNQVFEIDVCYSLRKIVNVYDITSRRNVTMSPCPTYIDGLVQDCNNSIANALELLQSCTKPSICQCVLWCVRVYWLMLSVYYFLYAASNKVDFFICY